MTIKDLREAIKGLPDDMPVYLSSDEEGNSYSRLREAGAGAYQGGYGMYFEEHGWDGNSFDSHEEWEAFKAKTPECCVLSP